MSVSTLSNQSISIENPAATKDRHGQPAFSAAVTALCRFERIYKTIITENRERDPIHAIAGLPAGVTISRGARVTYGTDTYRVIQVAEAIDGDGQVHHREAMLQLWSYDND